jgi:hypothetical protein
VCSVLGAPVLGGEVHTRRIDGLLRPAVRSVHVQWYPTARIFCVCLPKNAIPAGWVALTVDCGLTRMFYANCRYGQGTRDMAGPEGLTTEKFIDKVRVQSGCEFGALCVRVCVRD